MFWKRKKDIEFEEYEEETMTQASKEEELLTSYEEFDPNLVEYEDEIVDETNPYEEEENYDEKIKEEENTDYPEDNEETYLEDEIFNSKNNELKYKKIINIVFTIIMIILTLIAIDVISVARYNKGPFFAIPLTKYKDGGTKVYYGIGYKVIKYNQVQGRKDIEIGTWSMKYNAEPVTIKDIDLAIELQGRERETYEKYYKKFLRLTSTLSNIDESKNKITLSYIDEGGKYSLDIECEMATNKSALKNLEKEKEITIIGTVDNFSYKTKNTPNKIYIKNCYAEQ